MTASIVRIRPKRHDTLTQALQTTLGLPNLSQPTRDEIAEVLGRYEPAPTWMYTMLSREQLRIVLKKINASPDAGVTARVWMAAVTYVHSDSGEVMAGRTRLAEDAGTTPQEVSRALCRLAEMDALIRIRPGRYRVNPNIAWSGSLAKREAAAKEAPQLRLVET